MGHPDCATCARLDRATAYRYLGEPHYIPAFHGFDWLADDLRQALAQLDPGHTISLSYAGDVEPAPTVTLTKGDDLAVAARVAVPGVMNRELLHVSTDGTTYPTLVFEVMNAFREARGAHQVILIPPVGPLMGAGDDQPPDPGPTKAHGQ